MMLQSWRGVTNALIADVSRGMSSLQQGRIIRDFEGALAPPEHASAPSDHQKHRLEIKGTIHKIPLNIKIQQNVIT